MPAQRDYIDNQLHTLGELLGTLHDFCSTGMSSGSNRLRVRLHLTVKRRW